MSKNEKKLTVLTIACILLLIPTTTILADSFVIRSNYDFYQGGYNSSTKKHWTDYSIAGKNLIFAYITVSGIGESVANGYGAARVNQKNTSSATTTHTHKKGVY